MRSGSISSHRRGTSIQWPSGLNSDASTARPPGGVPSISAGRPTRRPSRLARVRARFSTMLNTQVTRLERPSKAPMPENTASQASWTTSSACARLPMIEVATPIREPWKRLISARNARSSPRRSRARNSGSSNSV